MNRWFRKQENNDHALGLRKLKAAEAVSAWLDQNKMLQKTIFNSQCFKKMVTNKCSGNCSFGILIKIQSNNPSKMTAVVSGMQCTVTFSNFRFITTAKKM